MTGREDGASCRPGSRKPSPMVSALRASIPRARAKASMTITVTGGRTTPSGATAVRAWEPRNACVAGISAVAARTTAWTCRRCDGEGYWVPTAADLKARQDQARWWDELHAHLAAHDSDGRGEASETQGGSVHDSAGLQGIAPEQPSHPLPKELEK